MKRKLMISGMLAATIITIMSSSLVLATTYSIVTFTVNSKGNVWMLNPSAAIPPFSGKDVNPSTVTARIYSTPTAYITVTPMKVVLTDKLIILVFNPADIPNDAYSTSATGTFINGVDTFFATGPGFVVF